MAKIELPDFDNTVFNLPAGGSSGSVFQPVAASPGGGFLSLSAPSYLGTPARVEDFASARDGLNRNMAVNRAFAKIDYPTFQPHDEQDWSILRSLGAVTGTMADYAFGKMEERKQQEDMTFVTETKGEYQRRAHELWSKQYEGKMTGYASQNEELVKQYQQDLNGIWDETVNRTPSREMARTVASRGRVDIDNNVLLNAQEKALNFEKKYAKMATFQGMQADIATAQTAGEWGIFGPTRAKALQAGLDKADVYAASSRGNALDAEELKTQYIKEFGRAILTEDAKRSPERFLASFKKGEYDVSVGLGLPGPNGEPPAKISLLTDENRSWAVSHMVEIERQMAARAAQAEARAMAARDKGVLLAQRDLKHGLELITDPEAKDADFTNGKIMVMKSAAALAAVDPSYNTEAMADTVNAMGIYRQVNSGMMNHSAAVKALEGKGEQGRTPFKWVDRKGGEHSELPPKGVVEKVKSMLNAEFISAQKDLGSMDKTLAPMFEKTMKERGIDPTDTSAMIAMKADVRQQVFTARYGKDAADMIGSTNWRSKEDGGVLSKFISSAPGPEEQAMRASLVAQKHGADALYHAMGEDSSTTITSMAAMAANPKTIMHQTVALASAARGKGKDAVEVLAEDEKRAIIEMVNKGIAKSPAMTAMSRQIDMSGGSYSGVDTQAAAVSALHKAALAMGGRGVALKEIGKTFDGFLAGLDEGIIATERVTVPGGAKIPKGWTAPEYSEALENGVRLPMVIEATALMRKMASVTTDDATLRSWMKDRGTPINGDDTSGARNFLLNLAEQVSDPQNSHLIRNKGSWGIRSKFGGKVATFNALPYSDEKVEAMVMGWKHDAVTKSENMKLNTGGS